MELAIYSADEPAAGAEKASPVVLERLPSTAGWTPAYDECLAPGRYAWAVRVETAAGWTAWSEPLLFEVRGEAAEHEPPAKRDSLPEPRDGFRLFAETRGEPQAPTSGGRRPSTPFGAAEPYTFSPAPCLAGLTVFSDVPHTHPFCGAIQQLYRDGIAGPCDGPGGSRFCPDNPVTRAQVALMLERVLQGRSPRQIDAGGSHNCAVLASGRVVCWGDNTSGKAPPGPSVDVYQSIAAGGGHTCGVRADDKVLCWGANGLGQAPPGDPAPPGAGEDTFKSVTTGNDHTCALRSDDKRVCWGNDILGQAPTATSSETFQSLSAGFAHTCGVLADGRVLCWGDNTSGQAPPGDHAPPGAGEEIFRSVSGGNNHSCAVRTDGKVLCWGSNNIGQAPPGPTADTFQSVSAGGDHTCGLRTDGKVLCWGLNASGQAPPGPSVDAFQSVSAGILFTCGVRSSGAVQCWGTNPSGATIPPLGL